MTVMSKCAICGGQIQELFLEKIKGAIIQRKGSKKHYPICFSCQKRWKTKEELLEQIK